MRVAIEHWVGDFKLDILCTDGEDQVIIENQLEESNHKHLGQIISYAAGVGAKKVIWVAESFSAQHPPALKFLNYKTNENLSFFCVEVELWRIGDSPYAPKFEVVVKPNDWAKSGREQARAATSGSPTKQLQQKFWMALINCLEKSAPQIRPQKPRPQHWLNNSIGRSGFGLNITANTRDERLGVEQRIQAWKPRDISPPCPRRKKKSRTSWVLTWTGRSCPMPKPVGLQLGIRRLSIEDENRWYEYLDWLTQRLVKMDQVLRPIVKALP